MIPSSQLRMKAIALLVLSTVSLSTQLPTYSMSLSTCKMSRSECEEECAVKSGWMMLCVENAEQNAQIQSKAGEDVGVWLGYDDRSVDGQWEWFDGCDSNYTRWNAAYSEPNGGTGEYFAISSNGDWSDVADSTDFTCGCQTADQNSNGVFVWDQCESVAWAHILGLVGWLHWYTWYTFHCGCNGIKALGQDASYRYTRGRGLLLQLTLLLAFLMICGGSVLLSSCSRCYGSHRDLGITYTVLGSWGFLWTALALSKLCSRIGNSDDIKLMRTDEIEGCWVVSLFPIPWIWATFYNKPVSPDRVRGNGVVFCCCVPIPFEEYRTRLPGTNRFPHESDANNVIDYSNAHFNCGTTADGKSGLCSLRIIPVNTGIDAREGGGEGAAAAAPDVVVISRQPPSSASAPAPVPTTISTARTPRESTTKKNVPDGMAASIQSLAQTIMPSRITLKDGEEVRNSMQRLVKGHVDSYFPEVLISYATGCRDQCHGHWRDDDAEGCGPGMLYCQAICNELEARGINTFSGLHVPAGTDWQVFLLKLNSRFSEAKVLIVIVTPAMYRSIPCLTEIFTALTNKRRVTLLPVLFENPIPRVDEQWPSIKRHETEKLMMLTKVQQNFGALNCIPSPPGSILDQPSIIDRVLEDTAKAIGMDHLPPVVPVAHGKGHDETREAELAQTGIGGDAKVTPVF